MNLQQTIVAPATGDGRGSIAVIRVSGPDALFALQQVFVSKSSRCAYQSHHMYLGTFHSREQVAVDQVLAVFFKGPNSFTGEDSVEVHCHGGSLISREVVSTFLGLGCRLAEPGEFSYRAFMNGKIDLLQAEATASLIGAQNTFAQQISLRQLQGELSGFLQGVRNELVQVLSLVEVGIDFTDQDIDYIDQSPLLQRLTAVSQEIDALLGTFQHGRRVRDGIKILILGKPNVGKSSLLNALTGEERAIVTDISGTTRDLLYTDADVRGIPVQFIDSAGIIDTQDVVEAEGVRRALDMISRADLLLYVVDSLHGLHNDDMEIIERFEDKPYVLIFSKDDLHHASPVEIRGGEPVFIHHISSHYPETILSLKQSVYDYFSQAGNALLESGTVIFELRHYELLGRIRSNLGLALDGLKDALSPEITAMELRSALSFLDEISGGDSTDDVLASVFSSFCIGK